MCRVRSLEKSLLSSLLLCLVCVDQISYSIGHFQNHLSSAQLKTNFGVGSPGNGVWKSAPQTEGKWSDHVNYFGTPARRNGIDVASLKRKFNAWGGKRSYEAGNRDLRGTFNSWGGKRSTRTALEDDKRATFNSWGGKRSVIDDLIVKPAIFESAHRKVTAGKDDFTLTLECKSERQRAEGKSHA